MGISPSREPWDIIEPKILLRIAVTGVGYYFAERIVLNNQVGYLPTAAVAIAPAISHALLSTSTVLSPNGLTAAGSSALVALATTDFDPKSAAIGAGAAFAATSI